MIYLHCHTLMVGAVVGSTRAGNAVVIQGFPLTNCNLLRIAHRVLLVTDVSPYLHMEIIFLVLLKSKLFLSVIVNDISWVM